MVQQVQPLADIEVRMVQPLGDIERGMVQPTNLTNLDPKFLPSIETDAGSQSNDGTAYHGTPIYQRF